METSQEKLVRLDHEMGLGPRQIVERARTNAPRLGATQRLAVQILSSLPTGKRGAGDTARPRDSHTQTPRLAEVRATGN